MYDFRMLTDQTTAQLEQLDRATPKDGDELAEVAKERGWLEAIRHFAERGMLTPDGQEEAAKIVTASAEWMTGLAMDELVMPPADEGDSPVVVTGP
jgi:hypothetical protein